MWSVGIILYALLYGKLPWKCSPTEIEDLREEICATSSISAPQMCKGRPRSQALRQLVEQLLQREPSARPNTVEVLNVLKDINVGMCYSIWYCAFCCYTLGFILYMSRVLALYNKHVII